MYVVFEFLQIECIIMRLARRLSLNPRFRISKDGWPMKFEYSFVKSVKNSL